MHIEQLYTNCLSEAAYFIASNGEAAVIDPLRDTQAYIDLAEKHKVKIKYIFETHFHADFVSGHLELAQQTGATIVYGPQAKTAFEKHEAKHGETFAVGNITLTALHTPGHTMESTCYLLRNEQNQDHCIFTGDTLFVGDVGRPDLCQKGEELTSEDLAATLYDSLQAHIVPLANNVIVYPAHGPGSSCGKNLGPSTYSTIGEQKETNYALQPQTKEEFVQAVTEGLNAPPQYFPINAQINKNGYENLSKIKEQGLQALTVEQVKQNLEQENYILLDTRHATEFTQGFIPGSIFIGLEGRFAEWAGSLLPFDKNIMLVTPPGKEEETVVRLSRVGLDKVVGYLPNALASWQAAGNELDLIIDIEPDELAMDLPYESNLEILDVRKEVEYADGHIENAHNFPLNQFADMLQLAQIDDTKSMYVHCAGGYRSVIAASLLKQQGFNNIKNVLGGYAAIKNTQRFTLVKEAAALN
jgi:hydroxyacylglutathione hydrolase